QHVQRFGEGPTDCGIEEPPDAIDRWVRSTEIAFRGTKSDRLLGRDNKTAARSTVQIEALLSNQLTRELHHAVIASSPVCQAGLACSGHS
ncbi:hypothetical protein, partial [Pseudomarimonas arenosa]|uniref:hypothetical protein n=1 Tax=Pseudomarimonas arenosa TaxID=2774145 RepID=UPI001CDC9790